MTTPARRAKSSEVAKRFGHFYDEAMTQALGIERNGAVRVVMMPAAEYERLRRRERVAGRTEDLDADTIEALRAVVPGPECDEAEARLARS